MDKPEMKNDKPELLREPGSAFGKSPEKSPITPKPASRFQRIMRISLFSLLGAVVLFLGGMLVSYLAFARPAQTELTRVSAELEAEKATVQQQEDELADLQAQVKTLQADLDSASLQVAVLTPLTDVMSARLAMGASNNAGTRLALNNLVKSLDALDSLASGDQKAVIAAMRKDLQAVMGDLESNPSAAQAGLEVLLANLLRFKETISR